MASAQGKRTDAKFTVEEYLAFIETRPEEERWQLIDGTAMLMNLPTIRHQGIASNLAFELNAHFRRFRPHLQAYQEVGLIVPEVELFRPEADVAVLDTSLDQDTSWAARFYFVAEIRSGSNTDKDIELKLARYIQHPDNLYCLVVDQKKVYAELFTRAQAWERVVLDHSEAALNMPEFEFVLRFGDLYRGTRLWRPKTGV